MIRTILLCAVILVAAAAAADETVEFSPGRDMIKVADPAASGGWSAGALLGEAGGKVAPFLPKIELAPGRYRVTVFMRLHLPADYDHSRLEPRLTLLAQDRPAFVLPLASPLFNGAQGTYTEFAGEFSLLSVSRLEAEFSWSIASVPVGEKSRPVAPVETPSAEGGGGDLLGAGDGDDEVEIKELLGEAIPIEKLAGAAILLDRLAITPLAAEVMVESVRPQKVHVYPGEENAISVTLRNFTGKPLKATARLAVLTGLAEEGPSQEAELELPAGRTATHRFPWKAGEREFGHEARAEAVLNGKVVHSAAEYFSVSSPVWKTAIQGSGFITWHGREWDFDRHVAANRNAYVNVEEAFSWQPSSWTDLTPETEDWWTGQCNFHNSMAGLTKWIGLSHGQGIKMITYIWPTASGRDGFEWARRNPHLATYVGVGLATEFFDVEDLRLWDAVRDDPTLWRLHYGVWQSMGINRGLLENMVTAADEVVLSAKRFGWDGIRFDCPPGWSAMGAEGVHDEFERFGVAELMEKLVPEHYATREGSWSGLAISTRNVRYFRHRLSQDVGADFAVSYNTHIEQPVAGDIGKIEDGKERNRALWLRELCRDDQQLMNEAIRGSGTWSGYLNAAMTHAEAVRGLGGHSCLVALNKAGVMARVYAPVYTFAVGSHPYLDYGWGRPMPGPYNRFATRYGEYFWDRKLVPVTPEEAGITVDGEERFLWKRLVRRRVLPDGSVQTVVHLITPPPADEICPTKPFPLPAWQRDVAVRIRTAARPVVWRLTAEPKLVCERLDSEQTEDGIVVTVPEHRYWTVLVFTQERKE